MIIKERTQDYIDIANILSKKISNVANNKEYSIIKLIQYVDNTK